MGMTTAQRLDATTLAPALELLEDLTGTGGLDERVLPRTTLALAKRLQALGLTKRVVRGDDAPARWGATHAGRDFLALAGKVATR